MKTIWLLEESLGYDGYYGAVDNVISAFASKEAAEKGLEAKRQDIKAAKQKWLDDNYEGGKTYPEKYGGQARAEKIIQDAGGKLFIREVPFNE